MNYKKSILLIVASIVLATAFSQKVYLIPALHNLHKTNQQYTYDHLKAIVQKIKPDVIAVEMRREDVASDTSYLKKNYPYEMWMMRYWFPKTTIEGFDWLGADLEGKTIPDRYWENQSQIKALQRKLNADSIYTRKLKACDVYTNERMKTLQSSSLKGILQSNESIFIKEYYNCLNLQLQNSDYEELPKFYDLRNQKMQERLSELVNRYAGQTIVVITGADHYPYLFEYLRKQKVSVLQPV
ncbi:hypothetical protein OCK74_21225 [Chitinophagaceae bacterium LB-8]|uniref:Uncharacterized protein n=1 Tax=Paraflavisolibacter caeni TaxID=2982496 RepID=A0A9X2XZA4_9BACT|nr:hypothetical protein [Paraflavisolibacter caeni]MCU7551656.1 hypothetical protein [Paraflavisolibacter caeni]